MRLLVYDIQGKIFVKARHFKKLSASRVKILSISAISEYTHDINP